MGDASGSEASPVRPQRARPVWVRRCLSCDRDDVSPAFGTLVPGASLVSLPARAPRARVRQRQPMSRCGPGMTPATMAVTPVPARFTHGLPVRVRIRHQGHTQRKDGAPGRMEGSGDPLRGCSVPSPPPTSRPIGA
jgi:hypothetical protein